MWDNHRKQAIVVLEGPIVVEVVLVGLEFVAELAELEFVAALEFVEEFVADIVEVELVGKWDIRNQGNYTDNTE
jgi:hypothetical protein